MDKKIGFIGGGNMGQAMMKGIVQSKIISNLNILVSDASDEKLREVHEKFGVKTTNSNEIVASSSNILFICVKPNIYEKVISNIKNYVKENTLIISIAPNFSLESLSELFENELIKIIRAMPNTPAFVGEAMSAITSNKNVSTEELEDIKKIFESFGKVEIIEEKLFDSVVATSGSSPAYIFMLIEAMADGAVLGGMSRNLAYKFAAQAVLGSAKMVLESNLHPGVLKDMVCSPGGTTIEAVKELEKLGFRSSIIEAMEKCRKKAKNM